MLEWYDAHARVLPWRVPPGSGEAADPYRIWMSEIMLQQTTVVTVKAYFERFTARWPTVADLAAAEDAEVMGEWAGLGYYARARNLLKCARVVVADHGGSFPNTEAELLTLPGIGPYTAAAVASIAFDQPAPVMDGNIERVMARLFAVEAPLPGSKPVLKAHATRLTPAERPGDHAQALMDLGATICTPRSPACGICPLMAACFARAQGIAADLPRKAPKKVKPTRLGYVYVARRADGALLLETRPEKGLLGGMLAFPTSEWSDAPEEAPPFEADWRDTGVEVRHTFTHFHLRLTLRQTEAPMDLAPERGEFVPEALFKPSSLPTLMRKAYDLSETDHDPA
ncbi:A/G-specific adenine glycosylase [Gymnodinialimonas ceratoperidinii]|uniref:Adenine DNA glycosylase n=1 Tax=Gymnodinialimonas ceratoperidinii TaxID=2856823 RepID=A0A8F6YE76_9RHOB|nr:A/G-specific adenine glycosylase [Gymnodinialimonas ceratoperidinii]QXT41305.1 A/G-specific adenine glycosylase [Gymnodinialimonas ceratoperidinii]